MSYFTDMADLTDTQASMAMRSKPLSRVECSYRPWSQIVAEHNAKPKRLVIKKNGVTVESYKGAGK